jgi:hypothetical protein
MPDEADWTERLSSPVVVGFDPASSFALPLSLSNLSSILCAEGRQFSANAATRAAVKGKATGGIRFEVHQWWKLERSAS